MNKPEEKPARGRPVKRKIEPLPMPAEELARRLLRPLSKEEKRSVEERKKDL